MLRWTAGAAVVLLSCTVVPPAHAAAPNVIIVNGEQLSQEQTIGACGMSKATPGLVIFSMRDAAPTGVVASFVGRNGTIAGVTITGRATDNPLRFWSYSSFTDKDIHVDVTKVPGGGRVTGTIPPIQPGGSARIGDPVPFEIVISDCSSANDPNNLSPIP